MEHTPPLTAWHGKSVDKRPLYAVIPALSVSHLFLGSQEPALHVFASILFGCSVAVVANTVLSRRSSRPEGGSAGRVDYTRIALLEHELFGIQPPEGSEAARLLRDAAKHRELP